MKANEVNLFDVIKKSLRCIIAELFSWEDQRSAGLTRLEAMLR